MAQSASIGISFESVKYSTKFGLKRETKEILHGISGDLPSSSLTAILGPSGSGKTTLLNILAGTITSNEGTIKLTEKIPRNVPDGPSKSSGKRGKSTGALVTYIPQETHLCDLLTVKETFESAAMLKCAAETKSKIRDVVDTLKLTAVYNTRVACLSGGEKKRVTLGVELLSDFDVILLDEPTTGLDSSSTQICIEYLKRLSANGKTVICTIHQPSATILEQFDYLYVLSDGHCLYEGTSSRMMRVLDEFNMKCPRYHNPGDFIIEIASGEYGNSEGSVRTELIKKFDRSEMNAAISNKNLAKCKATDSSHTAPSGRQLKALLWREYLKATRNPTLTYLRLATSISNSLVLCAIFWRVGDDGAKVWFNYNAILGFVLHLMMPSLMLTILTFPSEYNVLKRESINRWYSLKWYYAAVTIIDLPICIIYCLISNAIFYTLTAQPLELWRFATFSSLGFGICVIAQSFGLLVGSVFNVVNGTFIGSAISFPMMLFAGFGMTFKDIPAYISWIGHFSYLKYGVEGMAASVMGYNRSELPCPSGHCLYNDSQTFLDDMGVASDQINWDFMVLFIFFVFLRICTYLLLKKRVFCKR